MNVYDFKQSDEFLRYAKDCATQGTDAYIAFNDAVKRHIANLINPDDGLELNDYIRELCPQLADDIVNGHIFNKVKNSESYSGYRVYLYSKSYKIQNTNFSLQLKATCLTHNYYKQIKTYTTYLDLKLVKDRNASKDGLTVAKFIDLFPHIFNVLGYIACPLQFSDYTIHVLDMKKMPYTFDVDDTYIDKQVNRMRAGKHKFNDITSTLRRFV